MNATSVNVSVESLQGRESSFLQLEAERNWNFVCTTHNRKCAGVSNAACTLPLVRLKPGPKRTGIFWRHIYISCVTFLS